MEILQTVSDIGLYRDINEDYAFCINHPKDKKVKLLILADGMGGKKQGDVASSEVVATVEAWFYREDINKLLNIDGVFESLEEGIQKANSYLISKYGKDFLGTTVVIAIVGKAKTLFYNIGDSRGYIYKDKKLMQVTEDDSGVWQFYKKGLVHKDDLRFFPTNNLITACVGLNHYLCKSKCYIIDNDYEAILLFSDGVTDLLSDRDVEKILNAGISEDTLRKIINEAIYQRGKLPIPQGLKKSYNGKLTTPVFGRDNASGVIYKK